jgi:hypothetical protein
MTAHPVGHQKQAFVAVDPVAVFVMGAALAAVRISVYLYHRSRSWGSLAVRNPHPPYAVKYHPLPGAVKKASPKTKRGKKCPN